MINNTRGNKQDEDCLTTQLLISMKLMSVKMLFQRCNSQMFSFLKKKKKMWKLRFRNNNKKKPWPYQNVLNTWGNQIQKLTSGPVRVWIHPPVSHFIDLIDPGGGAFISHSHMKQTRPLRPHLTWCTFNWIIMHRKITVVIKDDL